MSATRSADGGRPKRNFVAEASKGRINLQAAKKIYPPGVYGRHHPSQCEHILRNRPIHLKLNSSTELKETCTIITSENVRELLVPSDTINVYPTIWSSNEMDRIRGAGTIVTKDQRHQYQLDMVAERERLQQECDERKRHLRSLDTKRLAKSGKHGSVAEEDGGNNSDATDGDEKSPQAVLDWAFVARQEQTPEVQRANRLIMAAKCQVIRDAQLAEKNEIEHEQRQEELRLTKMLQDGHKEATLSDEMRRDAVHRMNAEHGAEIKNQLRERELAKQVEADRIAEEAKAMALGQIAITLDMVAAEEAKKKQRLRVRDELQAANAMNTVFKTMAFEEQRIADMKAAEFQRQKQERDRQRAIDQRLARELKQREADRMLEAQTKLLDTKGQQDEQSMRRVQEEKEREFRRQQKLAAELKRKRLVDMEKARTTQMEEIRKQRAMNIVREEMDFRGVVERLEEAAKKERQLAEEKFTNREKYRADVMRQIKDKELDRRSRKDSDLELHAKHTEMEAKRNQDIQTVIRAKIDSMRRANIPAKFIKDVERNLEAPVKMRTT